MSLTHLLNERRAYRSLEPFEISEEMLEELGKAAQLMPSCFNNQPWRFVFVKDEPNLNLLKNEALSKGNAWARHASMIVVVFSKKEFDCVIGDRLYYQFDSGMATAAVILKATELNLVAHPIAGFSPKKVREIVNIPPEYEVITLLIVGKKRLEFTPEMSDHQRQTEEKRPERLPLASIMFQNQAPDKIPEKNNK